MRKKSIKLTKIPLNKIRVIEWLSARKDLGEIVELAKSIKTRGDVDVPIKVRPSNNGFYDLVWGRRRFEAAKLAGLTELSALIEEMNDEQVFIQSAIENLLRKNMNYIEEAEFFETWKAKFGRTYEEIARLLGVSKEYVYNRVQLLNLSPNIVRAIQSGSIDTSKFGLLHARTLLKVKDREQQEQLFHQTVRESLTVRELRRRVNEVTKSQKTRVRDMPMYVDLSQPIFREIPTVPKILVPPEIKMMRSALIDSVNVTLIQMCSHTGTHVDTPRQFFEHGKTIDMYDLSRFIGECTIIHVNKSPNQPITLKDVTPYSEKINEGRMVFFHTGWSTFIRENTYYMHPYLAEEVAWWLRDNKVSLIGLDTLTPEIPYHMRDNGFDYPIHRILLSNDILIIENLNLGPVSRLSNIWITAFPIQIEGCEAAPCRVVGWLGNNQQVENVFALPTKYRSNGERIVINSR